MALELLLFVCFCSGFAHRVKGWVDSSSKLQINGLSNVSPVGSYK